MNRIANQLGRVSTISAFAVAVVVASGALPTSAATPAGTAPACPGGDTGITLSPGFCATIFADNLGHIRHLVVTPDGIVYANSWSGRYYHNDKPPADGFLLALQDTDGTGRANVIRRFGPSQAEGAAGGTGVAFHDKCDLCRGKRQDCPLRAEARRSCAKRQARCDPFGHAAYRRPPDASFRHRREGRSFCRFRVGHEFLPVGQPHAGLAWHSALHRTRDGTWRYEADKTGQVFSAAERFATGIRNGEGFAFDAAGRLFVTQHGRDQLSQNWPKLYTVYEGADLPAEEVLQLHQGADFGWPECYYDQNQKKLVLAPEYGGDGGKTAGVRDSKQPPVAAFPGHWAPNDLLIYTGGQFPEPYRGGAFIAFHGSWNRAPLPQGGYDVAFQPMADGKKSGDYVIFANGFAGAHVDPGRAAFRPTGLAMGPDGALYIADDVHGRIWRVDYKGDPTTAQIAPAPQAAVAAASATSPPPPEGMHADAGRSAETLRPPPGATGQEVALGERIFHGEAANGTCSGCHGSDAGGTSVGPSLSNGIWVWGDGSLPAITKTIETGVPRPRNYTGVMPPEGGADLSDQDVAAVAAYVWAVGNAAN